MKNKIKPIKRKNGKQVESIQETGLGVPLKYIENSLCFNQQVAKGSVKDNEYSIHIGWNGDFYIQFKDMKGSIPKLAIKAQDLADIAYDAAIKHGLLNKSE